MDLEFEVRWSIKRDAEATVLDPTVFNLLRGVRQGGHLTHAAQAAGVSYRHAWGLLRDWEQRFGVALVSARQGRGAHLTEFGEALLQIAADTELALAPTLERVALDAAARLSDATEPGRHAVGLVSSQSEQITALRDFLKTDHRVVLDVAGSENALHRYRRGEADIVGFHLPMGELGRTVAAALINLLDGDRDQIWLLEQRTLGLMSRPTQVVRDITALPQSDLRLVNRQSGSGTRLIFDGLLAASTIATTDITGYDDEEFTHTAVAALVASRGADVAFGAAAAAAHFKLHFEPLVEERFYLAMPRAGDSSLRRKLGEFSRARVVLAGQTTKPDEFNPSVAALKRVHNAGFWKVPQRTV